MMTDLVPTNCDDFSASWKLKSLLQYRMVFLEIGPKFDFKRMHYSKKDYSTIPK